MEKSPFCQKLIAQRIADGLCDPGVIHSDITTVHARDLGPNITGYLAGFPCQAWGLVDFALARAPDFPESIAKSPDQGISRAGGQRGLDDDRSSLVTHLFRLWDEAEAAGHPLNLD